ncbi:PA3371 family protein [Pseudomonas mucidolens]|uniref:Uncharacterized protein n=1 Tax=Pseudomonas mucidolens TaxID=46679 RepID=A0A1H2LWT1_9PSED|nr:PA3371 family protein [Pseudomonas mucidolens]SDU85463.1 hypothetical protein SAMN05216202_0619 [Pseudomonas mucidolens]SQH35084.1 Uncharacterised protein [Pseudomonas mucidolens]
MTKPAWLSLTLALAAGLLGLDVTSHGMQIAAFVASGILTATGVLSLIAGKRFKFDPVLR